MLILKHPIFLFTLLLAFTGYTQVKKTEAVVIEGKVIVEATGKPVPNAHVYILDTEEEALTNSQGEFKIRSWQKTPFKLTVKNYSNYQETSVTVTDPSQKLVIRLKTKS